MSDFKGIVARNSNPKPRYCTKRSNIRLSAADVGSGNKCNDGVVTRKTWQRAPPRLVADCGVAPVDARARKSSAAGVGSTGRIRRFAGTRRKRQNAPKSKTPPAYGPNLRPTTTTVVHGGARIDHVSRRTRPYDVVSSSSSSSNRSPRICGPHATVRLSRHHHWAIASPRRTASRRIAAGGVRAVGVRATAFRGVHG